MHSIPRQNSIAQFVVLQAVFMHPTIDLDGKSRAAAVEIDDVSLYQLLAAKVKAARRASSQNPPKSCLGGSHFTAELLREQELLGLNLLTANDLSATIHKDRNLTP